MSNIAPWLQGLWQQLQDEHSRNKLPQAVLLYGPDGSGKGDFIEAFGRWVLCQGDKASQPACGQCAACRQLDAGSHPDWLSIAILEDKREILIDQIRDFCADIQLTASTRQGRVGLIWGADHLNSHAANALLKTLEEPPSGTLLLLIATRQSRVLPTIRSRCLQLATPAPTAEQVRAQLGDLAQDLPEAQQRALLAYGAEERGAVVQSHKQWQALLDQLRREQDPIAAASAISEADFDRFLDWWQRQLLNQLKAQPRLIGLRRLWDALCRQRRLGQLSNIKRLLALEGLFILYLQLIQTAQSESA